MRAVSDTGPLLHLNELNHLEALKLFNQLNIPEAVAYELKKYSFALPSRITIKALQEIGQRNAFICMNQHELDKGEAEAIALTIQEKADFFLTDDLQARKVAKGYGLGVHGTIGIILRAVREKKIAKEAAITSLQEIKNKSTLFITPSLVEEALKSLRSFKAS